MPKCISSADTELKNQIRQTTATCYHRTGSLSGRQEDRLQKETLYLLQGSVSLKSSPPRPIELYGAPTAFLRNRGQRPSSQGSWRLAPPRHPGLRGLLGSPFRPSLRSLPLPTTPWDAGPHAVPLLSGTPASHLLCRCKPSSSHLDLPHTPSGAICLLHLFSYNLGSDSQLLPFALFHQAFGRCSSSYYYSFHFLELVFHAPLPVRPQKPQEAQTLAAVHITSGLAAGWLLARRVRWAGQAVGLEEGLEKGKGNKGGLRLLHLSGRLLACFTN